MGEDSPFERLLSPGRIGSLSLRNRIVLCPMGTNLAEADGSVGDAQAAWFEARARGGAGLILIGSASVAYPTGSYGARQVAISDDRYVGGLRRVADDSRRHGAAAAVQLVHDGSQSLLDIEHGRPLLVPSKRPAPTPDELSSMLTDAELAAVMAPFSSPTSRLAYREADDADLREVVEQFASAADRAVRAGFGGIEIHAGHGYLIHSFLSPSTNSRTDRYGGDAKGRATLLVEVVRAVRAAVGADIAVWARIGAFELHRSPGQTIDDAVIAMRLAVAAGLDAVHVTAYAEPTVATGITDGHTPHVPGALLGAAARVRAELDVPVIAMGRLTPEHAEQALADGVADFVAMGRPLIADPELPAKLAAGHRHRVRPCAYQYRCIGSIFLGESVRCTVNADAGREGDAKAESVPPRRVLVVGGGPAGMDAARRLADAGHHVALWHERPHLGGRLAVAARIDPDLAGLLHWLRGAIHDAGVDVHLNRRFGIDDLPADVDEVVFATGATWSMPAVEGATLPHVRTVDDLDPWLDGREQLGPHVVVVGGGKAGMSIAMAARDRGSEVTVVAPGSVLASELGLPGRFRLVADARDAGVRERRSVGVAAIEPGVVVLSDGERVRADSVVLATAYASPQWRAPSAVPHSVIGDAAEPAGLTGAFLDARRLLSPAPGP